MTLSNLLKGFNLPLSKFLSERIFKKGTIWISYVLKFNTQRWTRIRYFYCTFQSSSKHFLSYFCATDAKNAIHLADSETKSKRSERWHGDTKHCAFSVYCSDESSEGRVRHILLLSSFGKDQPKTGRKKKLLANTKTQQSKLITTDIYLPKLLFSNMLYRKD